MTQMRTIETVAAAMARQSFDDVTMEPQAYGINSPWNNIQEWIDFESHGDWIRELCREFDVSHREALSALTEAMRACATLEELNAPWADAPSTQE